MRQISNFKNRNWNPKLKELLAFAAFFLILLAAHLLIKTPFGDDLYYAAEHGDWTLRVFLEQRYAYWTSRVGIEAIMMPLISAPVWVWKLLDICMVLLLVVNTADLFALGRKVQAQILFFAGIWMIPLLSINGAGWIVTTTNYLWTLSLGLVALRPLKHWLCQEKCAKWEYLVCPLCTLYAANMEQMGAILFGAYMVCGVYLLVRKRKASPLYLVQALLIIGMLYFVLSAPGNSARNQFEMERYFPEFEFLSIWQKALMGFLDAGQYYLAGGPIQGCYTFALLSGALLAALLQKLADSSAAKSKRFVKWCKLSAALAPFVFYWGVGYLGNYFLRRRLFPKLWLILIALGANRFLPGLGAYSVKWVAIQTAVYLALLLCTALTVWFIHGKSEETLLELTVLAAGFASKVILGFSPTVYVSGERTAIFCSMAFLIVAFRNIQMFWNKSAGWLGKTTVSVYMAVILAGNLYYNISYFYQLGFVF